MKILFICKSNIGRSQMAEVFFNETNPEHKAISAGSHVKEEREGKVISTVTEKILTCMKELDLDVKDQIMNQVTSEMVDSVDKVVSITPKETLPDYLQNSSKLEVWGIPDAGGTDMEFHNKVRDMVKEKVSQL